MLKIAFLIGLAFNVNTYKPHKCPQDFIWTQGGCIRDCKSQKFADCPDYFTLQFQPNFCALNQDGTWHQYTYECQACSSPGNIGVTKGTCAGVKKRSIKQKSPKEEGLKTIKCPIYRPTQATCPTLQYFVAPEIKFCGVSYEGQKKGFDFACSACKDKSIQHYFQSPCQSKADTPVLASLTSVGSITTPQTIINPQPQNPAEHEAGFCFDNSCCKSYQFCLQKKCTDRCAMMRCAGGCERGQCLTRNIQRN